MPRPVTTTERREMLALAQDGWSAGRIALAIGRPIGTVDTHIKPVTHERRQARIAKADAAALKVAGRVSVEVLAERWGISPNSVRRRIRKALRRSQTGAA